MYYDLEKKERIKAGDLFRTNEGCDALVVEYNGASNIIVEFQDSHKHKMRVEASQLRSGQVKNPYFPSVHKTGYVGVGKYARYFLSRPTREYIAWVNMLMRGYSESYKEKYPTYSEVTVCEEWHNYQVFAEWYVNHEFYDNGYDLDKDILVRGNKVYSPEFCTLVPCEINNLTLDSGSIRGDSPVGVSWNKSRSKYSAYLKIDSRCEYLGLFTFAEDASRAYVKAKEQYVKITASKWRGKIEEKVYHALMNWTVY